MELAIPSSVDPEIGPSTTTAVDLEIGKAVKEPAWLKRIREDTPHRINLWFGVCYSTVLLSLPFYSGINIKLMLRGHGYLFIGILLALTISFSYIFLIYYATVGGREPRPYVLRRSDKLSIESAFVLASSCWTLIEWDSDFFTAILGLIILFKLLPFLNLWLFFTNFNTWDCFFAVLIDVALFSCRYFGGRVALMAVTGLGVALHFIKDAYRQNSTKKIKNQTQSHLV